MNAACVARPTSVPSTSSRHARLQSHRESAPERRSTREIPGRVRSTQALGIGTAAAGPEPVREFTGQGRAGWHRACARPAIRRARPCSVRARAQDSMDARAPDEGGARSSRCARHVVQSLDQLAGAGKRDARSHVDRARTTGAGSRKLVAIGRHVNQIARTVGEAYFQTERIRLDKLAELSLQVAKTHDAISSLVRASYSAWGAT